MKGDKRLFLEFLSGIFRYTEYSFRLIIIFRQPLTDQKFDHPADIGLKPSSVICCDNVAIFHHEIIYSGEI